MKVLHKIIHCQRQKVSRKCVDVSVKTNEVETGLFIFYDDMFTTYLRSAQPGEVNKATV